MLSWRALQVRQSALPIAERWTRHIATRKTPNEKELGKQVKLAVDHDNDVLLDEITSPAQDELETTPTQEAVESYESDAAEHDEHPSFTDSFRVPDGQVQTHHTRKHGGRPLPLSPVIDPVFIAARNRWRMPKALPPKPEEMTPFQKKLAANPYAQALANPVRESSLTQAHLPNFFLLPLSLHKSPEPPHAPTWVPYTLWQANTAASEKGPRKAIGPQTYVDLSQAEVRVLERQSARQRDLGGSAFQRVVGRGAMRDVIVRKDLSSFVHELLQRGVLRSLAWLFKHANTRLITRHDGGAEGVDGEEAGAVLYLCPMYPPYMEGLVDKVNEEIVRADIVGRQVKAWAKANYGAMPNYMHARVVNTQSPPPEQNPFAVYLAPRYPLVKVAGSVGGEEGKSVPVYSLHDLLGPVKLAELVQGTSFEDARCVIVKGGDVRTVNAQMALLRLQNYIAQERDLFSTSPAPPTSKQQKKLQVKTAK